MNNLKMDDLTNLTEAVPNAVELMAASLNLEPKELRSLIASGESMPKFWTSRHEKQVLRDRHVMILGEEHAQKVYGDSKTFDELDAIAAQKIEAFKGN